MIVVVADTSALLASADKVHPEQRASLDVLSRAGLVVISPVVLAETDHLARRVGGPGLRAGLLDHIVREARRGRFLIPEVTAEHVATARTLLHRYHDLDLDLADAVSVVLAAEFRTNAVLTFDRRDFRTMRPLDSHEAFTVLPDDM